MSQCVSTCARRTASAVTSFGGWGRGTGSVVVWNAGGHVNSFLLSVESPRTVESLLNAFKRYVVKDDLGCFVWHAAKDRSGYGVIGVGVRVAASGRKSTCKRQAHRVFYEMLVGPVDRELVLDHLCRNRACVNPAHLEPVTIQENFRRGLPGGVRRRERCSAGHEYTLQQVFRNGQVKYRQRCQTCEVLLAKRKRTECRAVRREREREADE